MRHSAQGPDSPSWHRAAMAPPHRAVTLSQTDTARPALCGRPTGIHAFMFTMWSMADRKFAGRPALRCRPNTRAGWFMSSSTSCHVAAPPLRCRGVPFPAARLRRACVVLLPPMTALLLLLLLLLTSWAAAALPPSTPEGAPQYRCLARWRAALWNVACSAARCCCCREASSSQVVRTESDTASTRSAATTACRRAALLSDSAPIEQPLANS